MKVTSNDGKYPAEGTSLKPGAKDSLSGDNVTESFSPSASAKDAVKGKLGGMKSS